MPSRQRSEAERWSPRAAGMSPSPAAGASASVDGRPAQRGCRRRAAVASDAVWSPRAAGMSPESPVSGDRCSGRPAQRGCRLTRRGRAGAEGRPAQRGCRRRRRWPGAAGRPAQRGCRRCRRAARRRITVAPRSGDVAMLDRASDARIGSPRAAGMSPADRSWISVAAGRPAQRGCRRASRLRSVAWRSPRAAGMSPRCAAAARAGRLVAPRSGDVASTAAAAGMVLPVAPRSGDVADAGRDERSWRGRPAQRGCRQLVRPRADAARSPRAAGMSPTVRRPFDRATVVAPRSGDVAVGANSRGMHQTVAPRSGDVAAGPASVPARLRGRPAQRGCEPPAPAMTQLGLVAPRSGDVRLQAWPNHASGAVAPRSGDVAIHGPGLGRDDGRPAQRGCRQQERRRTLR